MPTPARLLSVARLLALSALLFAGALTTLLRAQNGEFPVAAGTGLAPAAAAKAMTLPPGFRSTLFAGEPDVHQPIAFTIDERGRLWVVENYSYPNWSPFGRDRILILEDTDGDGTFNKSTVFYDQLNFATGIAVGHGGVWVGSAPYLLFIPDKNKDDVPASGHPRWLGQPGSARDAQQLRLGPRWLALRQPGRVHLFQRRQTRRPRQRPHPAQRLHLALPPHQKNLRGFRRGHQ